ncbi:hypothetical protein C7212DRAFT_331876, partial [Tuber magnatum]
MRKSRPLPKKISYTFHPPYPQTLFLPFGGVLQIFFLLLSLTVSWPLAPVLVTYL